MAKTAKTTPSTKRVGGGSAPEGKYIISRVIICEEEYTDANGAKKKYDALTVCLLPAQVVNGVWIAVPNASELDSGLVLNGCWRTKYDAQGQPHRASGDFIDYFLTHCTGKSFDEAVVILTQGQFSVVNRAINLEYEVYQSVFGSAEGRVPRVNFLN
jgi:hypothetical protein